MATFVGKYLYVNKDVEYVEYFEAPTISSRSFGAGYGSLLGVIIKENVAGIGDTSKFVEFEKNGDKYYVIYNTREFNLSDTIVNDGSSGSSVSTQEKKNVLEKGIDLAKSLYDFFGKTKTTTTNQSSTGDDSTSDSTNTAKVKNETVVSNPLVNFLKKNWLWFLPTVILIPVGIYLIVKSGYRRRQLSIPTNSQAPIL